MQTTQSNLTISSIYARLLRLYGKADSVHALLAWQKCIEDYRARVTPRPHTPSHRDCILICYGDSVSAPDEAPLASLKGFMDTHLWPLFQAVHLLPFFPYSSDDGFSIIDYTAVSPRMGSWEDISALQEHFHLMVDGVINHISRHSSWFQSYLADAEEFKDFFIALPPETDFSHVVRPRTSPLLTPFVDHAGKTRHIWTTFNADQVDLNFASWRVLLAVLDALLFYVEKGATLIRLDAIAFVWKELGTACVHLPQTHEVIQFLRESIHCVDPHVRIITETNVPHAENISYFGSGEDEAQMVYNFALPPLIAHAMLTQHAHALQFWAHGLKLPNDKVCFFNFTASHDGIGLRPVQEILTHEEITQLLLTCKAHGGQVSYREQTGGEEPYELNCTYFDLISSPTLPLEIRIERFLLSQAIMLAMPGIPGVYFSSLFGVENYHDGFKHTGVPRTLNREKFNRDFLETLLAAPDTKEAKLFKGYQTLLSLRAQEIAFHPFGGFTCMPLHPQVFAIKRHYGNETLLALHNLSMNAVQFELPPEFSHAEELLQNRAHQGMLITLKPSQIAWLKRA